MSAVQEATTVRGQPIALHPSPDYVSDVIRQTGDYYEARILDELARRIDGGVLVDIGAMIGNHTLYLARYVAHRAIHAFEPAPVNLELLRRNVEPYPEVTVHPIALSDRPGRLEMAIAQDNRGWSTVIATDHTVVPGMAEFRTNAVTLDSFRFEHVRLLKVDVERHEPQVLAGAVDTITRCRPLIVVEDWEHRMDAIMGSLGYRLAVDWGWDHQTYLYEPVA